MNITRTIPADIAAKAAEFMAARCGFAPGFSMKLPSVEERMDTLETEISELQRLKKPTQSQEARLEAAVGEYRDALLSRMQEGLTDGSFRLEPGTPRDDTPQAIGQPGPLSGASAWRDTAHRTIERSAKDGHLPDHAAELVTALVDNDDPSQRNIASRWAATTGDPAYLRAFAHLLASPERGHMMWTPEETEAFRSVERLRTEMRSMSLTDANGGYMVPMTLDPALILTSAGSINPLRQVARVVQTATDSWTGLTTAGVTAEWKAEAAEVSDASPTMDDFTIPVHFGDAYVPYSFEVGMDAYQFLPQLQRLLVDAADQLQATAFTTGSGSGQPKGIVTALDGTVAEVNAITPETLTAADVYALSEAVPPRFRANAQWMGNLSILNRLDQFETGNGAKKFPELDNGRLLRRTVHENSNMDGTINPAATADNFALILGDWSNFIIVDRIGTTLELIPHLMGANRRPTGQRGALLWFRTGSDVGNPAAFRMLNVGTAA